MKYPKSKSDFYKGGVVTMNYCINAERGDENVESS